MDFLSESRRRVNLAGSSRSNDGAGDSRAAVLEQARLQRQARLADKQREQAANKIQTFWRNRHAHALEVARQRAAWDVQLLTLATAAQASGTGVTAQQLSTFIARYFFFARIATRARPSIPARDTPATLALVAADATRFRHLTKLLIASYSSTNKVNHLGSIILTKPDTTEWPKRSTSEAASLSPLALQWIHQTRCIAAILLEHIGCPHAFAIDQMSTDVVLLWRMLDANQWPFVKDPTQCTPAEKALLQRTQAALVQKLVAPLGQARLPSAISDSVTATLAASSSSSAPPAKAAKLSTTAPRRIRPVVDIFHCFRMRLVELTVMTKDGTLTPTQTQQKTAIGLMFATILRCLSLTVSQSTEASNPVLLSFVYHILSIPALSQRLRFLQLQALIPSLLAPSIWDRSLEVLTSQVRMLNARDNGSSFSSAANPHPFARSMFASPSYSWFDDTPLPAAKPAARDDSAMEDDPSSPPVNHVFFQSPTSAVPLTHRSKPISGLAWLFGNLLELVVQLDESKSPAASRSFSWFLQAIDQLIQAVPSSELPTLGAEGEGAATTAADGSSAHPPMLAKQFAIFGERSFLDRLCKRLLADQPVAASNTNVDVEMKSPIAAASASSATALDDVPIICVLIDSILFRWSTSSSSILNTLVFSSNIVKRLWTSIQRSGILERIETVGKGGAAVNLSPFPSASAVPAAAASSSSPSIESIFADRFFNLLPLFCTMYGHLLKIQDDEEFFVKQTPFTLVEVASMVGMLKVLLYHLYWSGYSSDPTPTRLRERFSKLFVQLRDRQSRRPFTPTNAWLYNPSSALSIPFDTFSQELGLTPDAQQMPSDWDLMDEDDVVRNRPKPTATSRASSLLAEIPFVLPFDDRVKLLYRDIMLDKQDQQRLGISFDHGRGRRIRIRRTHVLEDSFSSLAGLSSAELKGRIQVEFTDEHGIVEPGLDGGGLFKEYLTTLLKTAFDPNYNLFRETGEHFVYPNPSALDLPITPQPNGVMMEEMLSPDHVQQILDQYYFIGQMIAKALYDGIQIETQFALFFLRFCVGHKNYLNDLQGLDPEIYSSLMKLKNMKESENIADLGLTFSVDRQVFGVAQTIDLIPNGSNISVTNANKVRFIYVLSDYYLNRQMSRQSHAFRSGMTSILSSSWLRMFAAEELRLLISGAPAIDRRNLQQHTVYSSGYTKDHECIRMFWDVVMNDLTDEQVGQLMRFATSCSRAPLLGFQSLYPQFCIQRVNADENEQTLPTAATCMNLMRLPRYTTRQRLKEKLLYAISQAGHGFGLT